MGEQTVISHDSEDITVIDYCSGDGCFVKNLTYEIPDKQMEALIEISDTCEQVIEFGCKFAPLKNRMFGTFYVWWVGSDGGKKYYFDGGDEDSHVCGCAASSSCLQSMFNSTCNCDGNFLPLWTKDQGTLTNKASLPVKAFVYGGFISNMQEANITLSKLRCSGTVTRSQDSLSSCAQLKKSGVSVDGFYITKKTVEADIEASYCHMSNAGYTEDTLLTLSLPLHKKTTALNVLLASSGNKGSSSLRHCAARGNHYNYYNPGTLHQLDSSVTEHLDLDTATFTFQRTGNYIISHNNDGEVYSCPIKLKLNSEWIQCETPCAKHVKSGATLEIWRMFDYDLTRFHLIINEL